MSYLQNAPWTPSEKVDLLVNVLQSSFPDLPSFLLQIIHDHQVYPKWNDMPLPSGRSLHSSQIAFEEMSRLYRQQGRQPASQQVPLQYAPTPNLAPSMSQQRPFHEPEMYHTQQRALQPRPPRSTDSPVPVVTNGDMPPIVRTLGPEPATQEVRKKRGRPSKEEAEERDRALAAEGKVYQPKKRATKKFRASTGPPGSEPASAGTSSGPPQTPRIRTANELIEQSSGGDIHIRPIDEAQSATKTEPPDSAQGEPISESGSAVAQSPSDRLLANHRERQTSRAATPQLTTPTTLKEDTKDQ